MSSASLEATLETGPPRPLEVGSGTAVLFTGRCRHPEGRIRALRLVLGDEEHPVNAHNMPLPGSIGPGDFWWALVPVPGITRSARVAVALRAQLKRRRWETAQLDWLDLEPGSSPARADGGPAPQGDRRVAICMATFEPPLELFERQIASIREQTHTDWVCVISDDSSSEASVNAMREVVKDDPRFLLFEGSDRLGFYRNFERALRLAPAEAPFVAFADQDDRWYPEKLETLLDRLEPDAGLAYADMRIVTPEGAVISDTYWSHRPNNHRNFASLLITNTITGAASLFRRELLQRALPFPPEVGKPFHDHWIAQIALAMGPITYVDAPLHDYVQHEMAALGHARANAAPIRRANFGLTARARRRLRMLRSRGFHPGWRARYFDLYLRTAQCARVLEMRCGRELSRRKRRVLRHLIRAERSITGTAWLALRALRPAFGGSETVGRERRFLEAVTWRRLAGARSRLRPASAEVLATTTPPLLVAPMLGNGGGSGFPVHAASSNGSGDSDAWLTPILVDHFARDGSTLMMRLLATSPNIAVEAAYPYENKYFAYLWRWSRLLDRPNDPEGPWRPKDVGSLSHEGNNPLIGPLPWSTRGLIASEDGEDPISIRCFELAWREFSARAARRTALRQGVPAVSVGYYAEKHLDSWRLHRLPLPPMRMIVMLRDPRDTYLSIVSFDRMRGRVAGFGQDRTATATEHLQEIVHRQRKRLRWISRLADANEVPVVRYEDLVNDLPGVARSLESAFSVQLDADEALRDK
jgi:glycosyltransferase involved in cell wall biosynthesis